MGRLCTRTSSAADYKRIVDHRLSKPYPNFGSPMTQIREQKQISVKELSTISGIPEAVLAEAESDKLELAGEDLKDVQKVYWSLSALEATPADYRRLIAEMAVKASGD